MKKTLQLPAGAFTMELTDRRDQPIKRVRDAGV